MRVLLAGGSGAVGRRLVPQLVAANHRVTATTRSEAKLDELRDLGAEPVVMDGLDAASVAKAVEQARPEAIIHQMSALAGKQDLKHFDRWFAVTNELRTEGTKHLLAAAQATGARRFLVQSYTGWPNSREGGPVKREEDPLDPEPAREQRESLAAIHFLEQAVLDAPVEGVVLRYGALYGPGASEGFVDELRKRRVPVVGDGAGVWSWLHVDDAASATVAALEQAPKGVYNVVDDEPAEVADCLPYLAEAVGAKPPLHVPAWLGRLLAGEVVVRMMTEARGSSNAKARRVLDWEPSWSTWRDGFRRGLAETLPATGGESRSAA